MPDTEVAISELLEIDPDRVDAVLSPANGTDWLILKALDGSETTGTTEDVLAEIAELAKSDEREECDACENGVVKSEETDEPCKKCFGTGLLPKLGETPAELRAAAKASAPSGAPVPVRDKCPTCKGTGTQLDGSGAPIKGKDCFDCDGSGKDSTEPPSDKLNRVDADGHAIHEGDAKGREKVDKSVDLYEADDDDLEKAKLKAKTRNALPEGDFALPGRKYPINDINHARNALARVSENGTPEEKAKVRAAVHKRYPEIESATKADGTTYSAPNPTLAAMATKVGNDNSGTDDSAANVPGSPEWEAVDAETAANAATALMAAAELIRCFRDRENQEVAAGEGNDIFDAYDASSALCAVNDALGIMARMAFHEGLEAAKSLETEEIAEKAGKRLSRKSVESLAAVRDHITTLLGDDDPANETTGDSATKSQKDILDMTEDDLQKLVATTVAQAVVAAKSIETDEKAEKSQKKAAKAEAAETAKTEVDEVTEPAEKAEADVAETDEVVEITEVDETPAAKAELTPEQIEAHETAKAAKKVAKEAKRAEKELATKVALTKSIEESLKTVVEQNEVLKSTVATLTDELEGVKKMAAPSTISRTAPADAQVAAKARDERQMRIDALEREARETSDPTVRSGNRELIKELRAEQTDK